MRLGRGNAARSLVRKRGAETVVRWVHLVGILLRAIVNYRLHLTLGGRSVVFDWILRLYLAARWPLVHT